MARLSTGTLCTLAAAPAGYPYGSFVTVAFDDGTPVFLVSTMAEHTRNLQHDPRASLLVAEEGSVDPLANGRVTLLGLCTQVEEMAGPLVRRSWPHTRTPPTTPISATSLSGSCVWKPSGT